MKKIFATVSQKLGRNKFPYQACSNYGKNKTTYFKSEVVLAKTNGKLFY